METLKELEEIIEIGISAFADAAEALAKIKKQRLYKPQHATFSEYLKNRWGRGIAYGYRIAAAGDVISELREALGEAVPLPRNEHVATQVAVAAKAVEKVVSERSTATVIVWDIAQRVAELRGAKSVTAADVQRVGDVLAELAAHDTIDIAGEQVTLRQLVSDAASYDAIEARLRQREHIARHAHQRQLIARGKGHVKSSRVIELECDIPADIDTVDVVIYVPSAQSSD